jgi:RimJ/RimL family protein N-acetyltransferase
MAYYRKLKGDAVYLSPMNPDDAAVYAKWLNDGRVADTLGVAYELLSDAKEKKFLEDADAGGDYHFAVVRSEDDVLLGNASLFNINRNYRSMETGLFIGDAENWGKGYGKEALRLILGFAFSTINAHRVFLRAHSDNERALKCYESVGFKECGRARDGVFKCGGYFDMVYMDILETEFGGRRL